VQGVLEDALTTVLHLGTPAALTVAGRTDAGVHARGQVAHLDVPAHAEIDGLSLVRRLARMLPQDVRVWSVAAAPDGFDARFSALSRRYAYRVADNPAGSDPLRRHDVLWRARPLQLDWMNVAASRLLGEHDFAAYCRRREGASTIRTLHRLQWDRDASGVAVATVEADAFCHNMVRALVGALVAVGDARRAVEWPGEVLARRERDSAVQVMPPHGLTLEEVRYPPEPELAARAETTRRLRA
jgi:tRNA pseudouridine38-40 synthase